MNVVEPITVGPVGAGYLPEIDMSRPPRLTRRDVFLLSVAIAIVATIVVGSILFREKIEEIGGIGYVGIVLANAIGSATIVSSGADYRDRGHRCDDLEPRARRDSRRHGINHRGVHGLCRRSQRPFRRRPHDGREQVVFKGGVVDEATRVPHSFPAGGDAKPVHGLRRNRGWLLGLLGAEVHRGLLVGQGSQVHADRPSQLLVGGRNPAVPRLVTEAACRHQDLRQSALKFRSGQQ